jgi:protease II
MQPDPAGGTIRLGCNEEFDQAYVTVVVESAVQPPVWYDVDLSTGDRTERHSRQIPGYQSDTYLSERLWVPASDGVTIPVTVVRHIATPVDGSAPCLLYGYGAYESCEDPEFDVALPSLLDRGVVRGLSAGGLLQARVLVHEPAKWVAKLRATDEHDSTLLFRVELGEGAHTGPAGRFAHLEYEAEIYAFVLDAMGLA